MLRFGSISLLYGTNSSRGYYYLFLSCSLSWVFSFCVLLVNHKAISKIHQNSYRFIRHPLYASLLFLGTGIFLKDISIITALFAFVNFVALIATAKREEKEMIGKFGEEYIDYMQKTRMFIPFVV